MPPLVRTFSDPVPGNLGLTSAGAVVSFAFDEPSGVAPSDAVGNVADLMFATNDATPSVDNDAWSGRGRKFDAEHSEAFTASDTADGDSLLTRDLTIQVLIRALPGVPLTGTILARGLDGAAGAVGYYAYGLETIDVVVEGVHETTVRMFYMTTDGDLVTDDGATFTLNQSGTFLLTATRRWSPDAVVFRYYANDELIGESDQTETEIGGSTAGALSVGARKRGDIWENFLDATLEELAIFDYEMSGEEVAATFERLTAQQPAGVAMVRALAPPGTSWGDNPGNRIGKLLKIAGEAIGYAAAAASSLRAQWLPGSTWAENLTRWEQINGLRTPLRDSLDARRERVQWFLARDFDLSKRAIAETLADPLDMLAEDLEFLEYENAWRDDFATLEVQRWQAEPETAWTVAAGKLDLLVAGSTDLRWPGNRIMFSGAVASGRELIVEGDIVSLTSLPTDAIAGLMVSHRTDVLAVWFGVKRVAGVPTLAHAVYRDGALTVTTGGTVTLPIGIRILEEDGNTTLQATAGGNGAGAPFFGATETGLDISEINAVGFGVTSPSGPIATAAQASFDNFFVDAPRGDRPFHWYAYRDPGGGGSPDLRGAQLLIDRLKPAHTHAAVVTSHVLLCDDPEHGCDRGPTGGV